MSNKEFIYQFIAIEGNIGAGKTSLANLLSAKYNGKIVLEQFEDNPFLPKFYKNPDKYAFPVEMSFLAARYNQLKNDLINRDLFTNCIVSDYYIHKSLIFASKNLPESEFSLYRNFFNIIDSNLPKPDLLVYLYLNINRLKENINKRGRDYEKDIDEEYLEKIQKGYFDYLNQQKNITILIIDTNNIDFVNNNDDFNKIDNIINKEYTKGIHRIIM